jgi:DNA (cytosine-5)-methyltransferase 1
MKKRKSLNNVAPFTELSLFSGAGGGLLATKHLLGWQTVCYVEWDKYAVNVLKSRIRDGYLDDAPIWDDAFTFDGRPWFGLVDVVTAGFPCQPFSLAGKGLAENDPRNGWPAVIRILREVRPRYALLENVAGLLSKSYIRRIYSDLAEAGFDVEQDCVTAAEIGANHKRERLWLVAHTESEGKLALAMEWKQNKKDIDIAWKGSEISNASSQGLSKPEQKREARGSITECDWWAVEPELCRMADGVAHRVDRLRAIGNGQVPAVVREAWRRLKRDE